MSTAKPKKGVAKKPSLTVTNAGTVDLGSVAVVLSEVEKDGEKYVTAMITSSDQQELYKSVCHDDKDAENLISVVSSMRLARMSNPAISWPPTPDVDLDLSSYDTIIVAFSGGKDSVAAFLYLLLLGVPKEKIELWHHDIDGREGSKLMDWPCTRDYCRAFAEAFGVQIYYSWKVGGFEGEMDRNNSLTAPVAFETPFGIKRSGGTRGEPQTRGLFPQTSPDLTVRWCSAYLKIDVGATAIRNQERFNGKRTLFVTGERAQESAPRARYAKLEPHRSDLRNGGKKRHVDQWRAVHGWREKAVWDIYEMFKVNPHPAYRLGWGRVSCAACIFGSSNQFASLRTVNPSQFAEVVAKEAASGKTIKTKESLSVLAEKGVPYSMKQEDIDAATSETFNEPIILSSWTLPSGAFGESNGPT